MPYFFKLPTYTDLTISQQTALNEPGAIAISGGPGTGKSVVSLWRHIRNYDLGTRKSLLLTYTKTLETYLRLSASSENEDSGMATDRTYRWTADENDEWDEIIVDEAQDVEGVLYEEIKQFAEIVSYGADDKQIVYQHKSTTEAELREIFPDNIHHELDENFRNTYEIMHFAKALFPSKLIPDSLLVQLKRDGKVGEMPFLLFTKKDDEKQTRAILGIINQFKSETHNIGILVPLAKNVEMYYKLIKEEKIQCSKYSHEDEEIDTIENVHITTFKSSKGIEFDTVIIPDFSRYPWYIQMMTDAPITENDYYVGITRAKRNLYLICSREMSSISASTYKREDL